MKIKKIAIALVVFLVSITLASCNWNISADTNYESPSDYESTRIEMIQNVIGSVVVVETSSGYGSGIIFNEVTVNEVTGVKKYAILTAYSVVDLVNPTDMHVVLASGMSYPVTEALGDQDYEVGVVYIETSQNLDVYQIEQLNGSSMVELNQGEDLYAIGTPYQYTMFNYVSQGILGLTSLDRNDITGLVFMHSAETNPGMEGAPIFNLSGQLLGIQLTKLYMTSEAADAVPTEGINYALNMNVIAPILLNLDTTLQTSYEGPTLMSVNSDSNYNDIAQQMIQTVSPSVVSVIGSVGLGSGIVFDKETLEDGSFRYYILTNNHVVSDNEEVRIKFSETESEYAVKDYQTNENYDIAVLRVDTDQELPVYDIPPITKNEYVDMVVGQDVYAVGTPLSVLYHNYVTQGVISVLDYTYRGIYQLGIVHDAEINPGNSGGPLFNLNGDVIGVNVAKVVNLSDGTKTVYAEGLNYSLNINVVSQAVRNFTSDGWTEMLRSPKLGVTVVDYSSNYDLYPISYNDGVLVTGFDYTRKAYLGLESYDLIVGIDGLTVHTTADLVQGLSGKTFGDSVTLNIVRYDELGHILTMTVEVVLS